MTVAPSAALISQWFAPEPITVPVWVAHALRRAAWDVRVLTGIPNFPLGEVMRGYSSWKPLTETVDGFPVHRTPLYPNHGSSAIKRIANYMSWACTASLASGRFLRDVDVCLVYSSPATAALPAMAARRRFGTPYVLMVQDVWPDSIFASGFLEAGRARAAAEWGVGAFTQAAYAEAHSIAVVSPGMKELLVKRGVPVSKVEVVYNWVDEAVFKPSEPKPSFRAKLGLSDDDFLFMYAGNHGAAQDLSTLVEAFALLANEGSHIHVAMVGDGIEKQRLLRTAQERSLTHVHFIDALPIDAMAGVVAAADAHVVSLADQALFHITMPSKIQSLLASGKPILVSAPGDAAQVVVEAGAGMAAPPNDPRRLAEVLREMAALPTEALNAMASAGRDIYVEQMSERVGVSHLSSMLECARKTGGRR